MRVLVYNGNAYRSRYGTGTGPCRARARTCTTSAVPATKKALPGSCTLVQLPGRAATRILAFHWSQMPPNRVPKGPEGSPLDRPARSPQLPETGSRPCTEIEGF